MIDPFTKTDLERLAKADSAICISLYMPTVRSGREVQQNEIRFSNLCRAVEARLQEQDVTKDRIEEVLKTIRGIQTSSDWWQHQEDGLCLFAGTDDLEVYRTPLAFEELVASEANFYIRPVVELVQHDSPFFVLAVSQNNVRLLRGSRYQMSEVSVQDLPADLQTALNIDEYTATLQQHTAGSAAQSGSMLFHGQGSGDLDERKKTELLQYFQRIDEALCKYLQDMRVPLVFAGVDYLFPIFRDACHYGNLVPESIEGNVENWSPDQLRDAAWPLVQPLNDAERQQAIEEFLDLSNTEMTASQIEEIVHAARIGAVKTLLIPDDERHYGTVDDSSGAVSLQAASSPHSLELVNDATVHTLRNGGSVFVCSREELSSASAASATLRYEVASVDN